MYNIRASLQKYKIKKIHQKSPDRETVFNYHLNSGLTFNNHGFDTGKYDDPSVVAILTDSPNPSNYWKVLKHRLRKEGNESVTNCNQLKLPSTDGKYYKTDVATTEQLFRLIQSIPSPKAEPFKLWMAQVAKERLDEMQDPELTIDRAMREYKALGYSDNWINQRLKSIEIRKDLTDEWNDTDYKRAFSLLPLQISSIKRGPVKLPKKRIRNISKNTKLSPNKEEKQQRPPANNLKAI